jgi:hypothetical protein
MGAARAALGNPQSATAVAAPGVVASVTSADKVVTGTFGRTAGLPNDWQWNWFLRGSGPLDENAATAPVVLADLSGLRSDTKVGAGVAFAHFPWWADSQGQFDVCRRAFADTLLAPDTVKKRVKAALALGHDSTPEGRVRVQQAVADTLSTTALCRRSLLDPRYQSDFDEKLVFGRVFLLSASAEYGRRAYRYVDTVAVADRSPTTEAYALSFGAGMYFPAQRLMVAGTLRWERSWDPGAARQYCVPLGAAGALQCRTTALSAPTRREPVLLQLEGRWFATSGVGFSPRVTVDVKGDQGWGVELPVLLRQPADKGFTTAVGVGWRSKPTSGGGTDQLYLSLTVGVTFGVALQ